MTDDKIIHLENETKTILNLNHINVYQLEIENTKTNEFKLFIYYYLKDDPKHYEELIVSFTSKDECIKARDLLI